MVSLCSFCGFFIRIIYAILLARANIPEPLRTKLVILIAQFFNRFRKRTSSQIEAKFFGINIFLHKVSPKPMFSILLLFCASLFSQTNHRQKLNYGYHLHHIEKRLPHTNYLTISEYSASVICRIISLFISRILE